MDTPTSMSTELLTANIENAINNLLPLFEVTEKELVRFEKPTIRRFVKPSEHPVCFRNTPAYSFVDNFIYFPLENNFSNYVSNYDIFSQAVIHHETSHYVHNQLNPGMGKRIDTYLRIRKMPPGFCELCELVAEYGNLILDLRDYDEVRLNTIFAYEKKIYDQYGPEFLPRLARMTLEEVVKKGVIKV